MKKYLYILIAALSVMFSSCTQKEPLAYEGAPLVQFANPLKNSYYASQKNCTFYYSAANVTRDTIYVPVTINAAIPTKDCQVSVTQYTDTNVYKDYPQAKPGIHYLPFDDVDSRKAMVVKKGNYNDSIPIVILRDASLKNQTYVLALRLQTSGDLLVMNNLAVTILISDRLSEPADWSNDYFGKYGTAKHAFMIDDTGERWDDAFCKLLKDDSYLLSFYNFKFRKDLLEKNQERLANGLPVLAEDDGTEVTFPDNAY